jgi:hypothetical protein
MMAICKIKLHLAWWVRPYLILATAIGWTVAPFARESLGKYLEHHAAFVTKHGVRCIVVPADGN